MKGIDASGIFLVLFLCLSVCFLKESTAFGEETLTFYSRLRLRYEAMNTFNKKFYGDDPIQGTSNDQFLLGQFRVRFNYRPFENMVLALGMQHSEVWDSELTDRDFYNGTFGIQHSPYRDRWEPYDTYAEFKNVFHSPLTLKLGRQTLVYGDKSVFGSGDWGNTCAWIWDAAKLTYKFRRGFVDVYYGRNIIHEPDRFSLRHRYAFESAGVYSQFELPERFFNIVVEPFFLIQLDHHNRFKGEDGRFGDFDSYYFGVRGYRKDFEGFDYDATFVSQRGDFSHDSIEAYGYKLLIAYSIRNNAIKPRITIAYSFASGDDNPNDGDHESFGAAFGST